MTPGSASDGDSGSGCYVWSSSDDSYRDAHSSGGSAEDHPTAGGDARHADPAAESAQPRPSAHCPLCRRVPRTAARSGPAAHQESGSPRGRESQNARQAQRGEQLDMPCYETTLQVFFFLFFFPPLQVT